LAVGGLWRRASATDKALEALKTRLRMIEAERIEEMSSSDALADYSFKRVCGVSLYLDLEEDSKSVGQSLREQIMEFFDEADYEVFVEDGPHSGSFHWGFFARSRTRLGRKDHNTKIEKIRKRTEDAASKSL
jgi:hypothetical protein